MFLSNDKRCEFLVWGFIRNIERAIKGYHLIPSDIYHLIYIHQMFDRWNAKYETKNNKIDVTRSIISITGDDTAFGTYAISRGVFTWRVIIISSISWMRGSMNGSKPHIGIIEDNDKYISQFRYDSDWDDYGYKLCAGDGSLYSYSKRQDKTIIDCLWNKEGDILEMMLDLNERTLSFKINNKDFGILFRNIKQCSYRLALSAGSHCSEFMIS